MAKSLLLNFLELIGIMSIAPEDVSCVHWHHDLSAADIATRLLPRPTTYEPYS